MLTGRAGLTPRQNIQDIILILNVDEEKSNLCISFRFTFKIRGTTGLP